MLLLLFCFMNYEFIHVHCTGNFVADALAKKAKNFVSYQVWLEELPKDIAPLADFDVH